MNNVKRGYRFAIALLVLALVITAVLPFVLPNSAQDAAYANSYTSSYTGTYYNGIDPTLTGSAMRSQLEKLITSTHKKQTTYDELKSIYGQTDIDPSTGKLVLFYTGTQVNSYSSYGANREHVWPKDGGDAFPASSQAGSDAHHLRPCDQQLNSTRGSLSFGETTAKIAKQDGSTTYGNLCYTGGGFFYPGKGFRGATARILMYVQTRWGTQFSLRFVDGSGKCKTIGDFDTLYKWHLEEPPSELEIYRNEQVAKIQGNRNPFIDHPEYAYQIYSVNGSDYYSSGYGTQLANSVKSLTANNDVYGNLNEVDAESISLNVSTLSLSVGQTYQASVRAYPTGASNAVNWSSSNDAVVSVSSSGVLTAKSQGAATITATSKNNPSLSATMTVTVKQITDIIVEGTPTKTIYDEGDTFNPSGLTVKCVYSDGTTETLNNSAAEWLDGTTKSTYLSVGTTSVICKFGSFQKTVGGITVNKGQAVASTATITRASFQEAEGAYAWQNWTAGSLQGQAFMYGGNATKIQMNTSKTAAYFFNTSACTGGISSIKVNASDGAVMEVFVSNVPFTQGATPTGGTSLGQKTLSGETEWKVDGDYTYFAVEVVSGGATYFESVIVSYGKKGSELPPDNITLDKNSLTLKVGESALITANATGEVEWSSSDQSVVTVDQNGSVVAVAVGSATITATRGSATATCTVTITAQHGSDDEKVTAFKNSVQNIHTSGAEAEFEDIKRALTLYGELTAAQKAEVQTEYEQLKQIVNEYNQSANEANQTIAGSLADVLTGLSVVLSALLALIALLKSVIK